MSECGAGNLFFDRYAEARAAVLAAAKAIGATVTSYLNEAAGVGPDGEPLVCDVIRVGSENADKLFIMSSGTHGIEGYCGSAIQLAWLSDYEPGCLPADCAVLIVHGVNPWGFAYKSRTNENNVDVNRNFIDFNADLPSNPDYSLLHSHLCPDQGGSKSLIDGQRAVMGMISKIGLQRISNAIACGQYSHNDGIFFGGFEPEWSNRTAQQIVKEHLGAASKVAMIDWHTGLGEPGKALFLYFNLQQGPQFERACSWWGQSQLAIDSDGYDGDTERPEYEGLLLLGIESALPQGVEAVSTVVEIGTRSNEAMMTAVQQDRWLKFVADRESEEAQEVIHDMMDAFCGYSNQWRQDAIASGLNICKQTVQGLIDW